MGRSVYEESNQIQVNVHHFTRDESKRQEAGKFRSIQGQIPQINQSTAEEAARINTAKKGGIDIC